MHGTELRLFGTKAFPKLYCEYRASDIATVGTTFNVFSYDNVWAEHRTHRRTDTLCVMPRTRVIDIVYNAASEQKDNIF